MVVFPVALGYVTTHIGRAVVPPNHLGVPHEDVKFTTSDGLELEGWYIPSKNGAAVISFPGRSGPQKPARMLARHGYGVLLFDRRGEGESEGEPNSAGWGGGKDIKAAIEYLQRRPDVDPDRIGGIGLSVGGEMMLETAAGDRRAQGRRLRGRRRAHVLGGHGRGPAGHREGAGRAGLRVQDRLDRRVREPAAAGEPEGPGAAGSTSRSC